MIVLPSHSFEKGILTQGNFDKLFFLTPPALPSVPVIRFHVWQTYSLSYLAFKKVTRRSTITRISPLPCYPM